MPGPWSATSTTAVPSADESRTASGVPGGVCARQLASRLPIAWWSRRSSPLTTSGSSASWNSSGHSGCSRWASVTRSPATVRRSTGSRSSGRPWSSRASSSRSSTRTPIRDASSSIRRMASRQVVGTLVGAVPEQLGVAAHGCQRGAQLVAGVGDEPPQPRPRTPRARGRPARSAPASRSAPRSAGPPRCRVGPARCAATGRRRRSRRPSPRSAAAAACRRARAPTRGSPTAPTTTRLTSSRSVLRRSRVLLTLDERDGDHHLAGRAVLQGASPAPTSGSRRRLV